MGRRKNPAVAALNDQEFVKAYLEVGNNTLAASLGVPQSTIATRIHRLREKGVYIPYGLQQGEAKDRCHRVQSILAENGGQTQHAPRLHIEIKTGTVIVFGDAHYWPGQTPTAHRALVKMIRDLSPAAIICNGDAVDMASVSRHPPIGWERLPTVQEEIECAQDRLGEIIAACPKRTRKTWNLGNHDARFETRLASVAPEYAKVAGIHLHDHFPEWSRAWATWINNDVVVKHRFLGGKAARDNTVRAGKTMITGHLHAAGVTPFTDYNGTRFSVDAGCVADPQGDQFVNYTEDNPKNWVSAFAVLTFDNYKLLWPELVVVWDKDHVQFRGKLIKC